MNSIERGSSAHHLGQDVVSLGSPNERLGLLIVLGDNMRLLDYSRAGEVAMSGIALIEMAFWDIAGMALNQSVYRLLDGAVRQRIKAYANG